MIDKYHLIIAMVSMSLIGCAHQPEAPKDSAPTTPLSWQEQQQIKKENLPLVIVQVCLPKKEPRLTISDVSHNSFGSTVPPVAKSTKQNEKVLEAPISYQKELIAIVLSANINYEKRREYVFIPPEIISQEQWTNWYPANYKTLDTFTTYELFNKHSVKQQEAEKTAPKIRYKLQLHNDYNAARKDSSPIPSCR